MRQKCRSFPSLASGRSAALRTTGVAWIGVAMLAADLAAQVPAPPRDSADSARAIAPVVVTVVRAPFSIEQAPLAVAFTTTEEIRAGRPGLALDEALRALPGVHVDNRYNYSLGERISIRGFGARSQFGVRGLRVLVDGIPATLPDGQTNLNHVDLGILGRSEVIRGPASAIYGNAAGGVILFASEAPAAEPVAGRIRVTSGGGSRRLQSVFSGSRSPFAYLVSVSRLDADGPRQHDDAEITTVTARAAAALGAGDFEVTLNAVDFEARNPGSLSDSLLRVDRTMAFRNNVVQRTGERGKQGQLGARWTRDLGGGSLELSAHALTREIDNPIPPRIIALTRAAGGGRIAYRTAPKRLGARVTGGLSLGGEAQLQRDDRLNFVNDSGRRAALVLDQRERVDALGPFALLWADVANRLSLLAGARYDRQKFGADDALISGTNPDDSGERTMSALSPSVGVSVEVRSGLRLYGNVASAFETPTTTELANRPTGSGGFNPDLEPQRTTSLETGVNARLGTLGMAQASVYQALVRDALVSFEVPGSPGRTFFRNTGEAAHRGAEVWVRSRMDRAIGARAAYSYVSARFENGTSGGIDLAGRRIPGIAPHRFDGSVDVSPFRSAAADLRIALDGRYVAAMPTNDIATFYSPPYAVADVRVWLAPRGSRWLTPFAGVSNLFDREYNSSIVINAAGRRWFEPGPGRVIHFGLEGRLVP